MELALQHFCRAMIPEPCMVLGTWLRPFSMGAFCLMAHAENPFVIGGKPTIGGLVQGCYVCSRPFAEALAGMGDGSCLKWCDALAAGCPGADVVTASEVFAAYVREGMEVPDYYMKADDSSTARESGAHAFSHIRVIAMEHLHRSAAEVMDSPLKSLVWDVTAWIERQGTLVFRGDKEAARAEFVKEFLDKHPELKG
jgi:hypothetical protein